MNGIDNPLRVVLVIVDWDMMTGDMAVSYRESRFGVNDCVRQRHGLSLEIINE